MIKSLKSALIYLTFAVFKAENKLSSTSTPFRKIWCHETYIENDLPTADDMKFPDNSIFFVETSCKGGLDSRQACAVESAARANPLWQVNVLFAGPVNSKCQNGRAFSALRYHYGNIKFFRIHTLQLANNTPFEDFMTDFNPLESSYWPVSHASDILRYLILFKWSGIYLDLDMIVLKPFNGLARNWAAKEKLKEREFGVASGALAFSSDFLGREMAAAAVEQMKADFRGWNWVHNGPGVIYRALRRLCMVNDPAKMTVKTCNGFAVYDSYLFYPVVLSDAWKLFRKGHVNLGSAYTCHFWGAKSHYWAVHRRSPYVALAARHCPRIRARFGRSFGAADLM